MENLTAQDWLILDSAERVLNPKQPGIFDINNLSKLTGIDRRLIRDRFPFPELLAVGIIVMVWEEKSNGISGASKYSLSRLYVCGSENPERLKVFNPKIFLLCILLQLPLSALAQDKTAPVQEIDQAVVETAAADSLAHSSSRVLLPVLGYTPDTGVMLGGTVLQFFYLEPEYEDSRPSVFSPVFIYTLKNQIMVYLGLQLNWDENRNALNVVPHYLKFPDKFYGTGRQVSTENEEDFTSKRFGTDLEFNRQVWGNWRLGLSYSLIKHKLTEIDPEGQLASGSVVGTEESWLSGLGPVLIFDNRDNTWAPDQGWFLQASARLGGSGLGSDYTYEEYTLDLRGYWSVGENTILAGQYLTTRMEGDVPFFILPLLGGESALRGYRGGLYRDSTRALGRLELRRSNIWKRLGGVVFAGIGDVAPSPQKLTLGSELWTAGFGLRYMLEPKERLNIRMDFGFGNGDSGFYLSLGEAF